MAKATWQSAVPNFESYGDLFSHFEALTPLSFLAIQKRVTASIIRFEQLHDFCKFLIIKSPDNSIYHHAIVDGYHDLISSGLLPKNKPIVIADTIEASALFGQYSATQGVVTASSTGLLKQADSGYLMISAELILNNLRLWPKLKTAVLNNACTSVSTDPNSLAFEAPKQDFNLKLVIIGSHDQLSNLDMLDENINQTLSIFAEIETDYDLAPLNDVVQDDIASNNQPDSDEASSITQIEHDALSNYLAYLTGLMNKYALPGFQDGEALNYYLIQGAREIEDQYRQPLCPIWHTSLLSEATIESQGEKISKHDIEQAMSHKKMRSQYLPERVLADILEGQVVVETKGSRIGQINGLTVVEIPGHPQAFGEPVRISCVTYAGDSEISDIERKVDLGGNLHAKGMLIMESFLASTLELEDPLPLTASIVFEQSYGEIDGDSASLAELSVLVSALSGVAINQQIAVTGSLDQFGQTQAVGGLNEKIEGFYYICKHQGLTGEQGVVIPDANLRHLSLEPEVVTAIKEGQFHLWSVSNVIDLFSIIFDNKDDEDVLEVLFEKIADADKPKSNSANFLHKIKNLLTKH